MTNQEAKAILKANAVPVFPLQVKYRDWLDALEMAAEALEKQIPKKPARRTIYAEHWREHYTIRVCPVCGVDTPVPRGLESWEFWCPDCGQALDWSEA